MLKDTPREMERQERSRVLEKQLVRMLWPALVDLKQKVDRRLVKTFLELVMVLVMHRHRNQGLVLSEDLLAGCRTGSGGDKTDQQAGA